MRYFFAVWEHEPLFPLKFSSVTAAPAQTCRIEGRGLMRQVAGIPHQFHLVPDGFLRCTQALYYLYLRATGRFNQPTIINSGFGDIIILPYQQQQQQQQ